MIASYFDSNMILLLVLSFLTLSASEREGTICRGDGDCQPNQICSFAKCYWIRSYGEPCYTSRQCRGFNVRCRSDTCGCSPDYEYDRGNCRYVLGCYGKEEHCGVGYKCDSNQCKLLKSPGLDAGSIAAIILGVLLFVTIVAGVAAFFVVLRRK